MNYVVRVLYWPMHAAQKPADRERNAHRRIRLLLDKIPRRCFE